MNPSDMAPTAVPGGEEFVEVQTARGELDFESLCERAPDRREHRDVEIFGAAHGGRLADDLYEIGRLGVAVPAARRDETDGEVSPEGEIGGESRRGFVESKLQETMTFATREGRPEPAHERLIERAFWPGGLQTERAVRR